MMNRRMLLGAAIAALVAFAAPAAQAEFKWHTNGLPIATHDIVSFEGDAAFHLTSTTAGADATVEATMTLNPGTVKVGDKVGEVIEFHVSKCIGTKGLAGTTCTSSSTFLSWPVTLKAQNTLEVDVSLHQLYWSNTAHTGTPVATTLLTGGVLVEIDPTNVTDGILETGADLTANGNPAKVEGYLSTTSGNILSLE